LLSQTFSTASRIAFTDLGPASRCSPQRSTPTRAGRCCGQALGYGGYALSSPEFQQQDALLRQAVEAMRGQAIDELSDPKLRQLCRKVLDSLQEHWLGLIRFVDDPRIPLDNNASEQAGRGPAVARKNFYGSGSLWSGRLAAAMFSLFATLARRQLNPRLWLTWYLESCAAAGGKTPEDLQPFLPWNLSPERRAALAVRTTIPAADTS